MSFTIREADLAAKLGVARVVLKDLRDKGHLNGDWQRQATGPARPVLYTEAGASRAAALLGIPQPVKVESNSHIELEELRVLKADFVNRRILHAINQKQAVVTVRVRSADNFVPRMAIKARPVNERIYEYYGKYPRSKGRM